MSTSKDPVSGSGSGSGSDSDSDSGCSRRRRKTRKTEGEWSSEDDEKLAEVVRELGTDDWSLIASRIPGRSDESCRTRWFDYLRCGALQRASDLPVLDSYDSLINDPETPEELKKYWELKKQVYLEGRTSKLHVMGSSLVEISSISISLSQEQKRQQQQQPQPFGIYGYIILIDDLGNEFLIFKQDQSDPLTLECHNDDALCLTIKNFKLRGPRCLPAFFNVHISLKDTCRKDFIVDTEFRVLYKRRPSLDDSCEIMLSPSSYPRFVGNIYRSAVVAFVSVSLVQCEKENNNNVDGDESTQVNVSGSVVASIQVNSIFQKLVSRELFFSNEPRIVNNYGDKEEALVESAAIAVPSYSSLEIRVDLTVAGTRISDSLNFTPKDQPGFPSKKVVAREICSVAVSVIWYHPFHCLPESVSRQWCHDNVEQGESSSEYASSSRAVDTSNKVDSSQDGLNSKIIHLLSGSTNHSQTLYIQPRLLELSSREWLDRVDCESLMEIFSVSICYTGFPCGIGGAITAKSAGNNGVDYFKLGEHHGMGLPIFYPHGPKQCHRSSNFGMALDLMDAKGHEISYGYLSWNDFQHPGWMNQRICSVIPGKHGHACVHYMIIEDALQAKLKCTVRSNDESIVAGGDIEGDIFASYSNFRYATPHDNFLYRSALFTGCGHAGDGGELPLFKSAVAVPVVSGLIVSVIIKYKLSADDPWIRMTGKATFKPRGKKFPSSRTTVYPPEEKQVCEVGNYSIAALVEWE